ncbi:MAG TPA: CBM20 domain-containing protein [Rariglobus sp.]
MKKSTVKAAKTTAPAKKTPAKIVKKAAAAPTKRAAAPAVKASAKLAPTVITATIDVGFGNTLYLRGDGPGLSWDAGVALDCVGDSEWRIALPGTGKPVTYKFLINDLTWSGGEDYVAASGAKVSVTPSF